MSNVIFDRKALKTHRNRAASTLAAHDFLLREMAERLADRLGDITHTFPTVLDLGCHHGVMAGLLAGRSGITTLVQADLSEDCLQNIKGLRVVADEEFLPFAPASFDLIVSCGSLHWVNDLPGALVQIRRCLKPDGLFLATALGGETLVELRDATVQAGIKGKGLAPRVSPFMDVRDAGSLLQRAGFALPVVDAERVSVRYENALKLMKDLRGMGETNVLTSRLKHFTPRAAMLSIVEEYQRLFAGEDGRIPATFEFITLTGWAPHESQQQPAKRGSGKVSLAKALRDESE